MTDFRVPGPRASLSSRVRGKLLFIPATATLMFALRRKRRTEIWIGDSHAMSFNREISNSMFMRAPGGHLIFRVGAKVMWSLARNGFPARTMKAARVVGRLVRPGSLVPVFSAGEIDVRAHLVAHPQSSYGFVAEYVEQCRAITSILKADRSAYVVPPPPCNLEPDKVWFPMVGTFEQRLEVFHALRSALAEAVGSVPGAMLIDFTPELADPDGALQAHLTDDGCHTNALATSLMRAAVRRRRLTSD